MLGTKKTSKKYEITPTIESIRLYFEQPFLCSIVENCMWGRAIDRIQYLRFHIMKRKFLKKKKKYHLAKVENNEDSSMDIIIHSVCCPPKIYCFPVRFVFTCTYT